MLFCYQKRPLFELCETLAENKNIYCSQVALSLGAQEELVMIVVLCVILPIQILFAYMDMFALAGL